ncbi:MAG: class I SAM-dependent methyltransferase [Endomicrobium sp.]|jgi:ubiquinone/menaquinone biosynthesis C-methylase UbiE|nr:class I SAM-dependent methyltransferase [Endomicrobium sp.]
MKFLEKSYQSHQNWYQNMSEEERLVLLQESINREDPIEFKKLFPILNPNDTWFTVGDSYGTDAMWLSSHCKEVTATDILKDMIELAQQKGYIKSFSAQNTEKMTFEDDSFDFACCRDTFHHFPRPYLAVYEMLRCAKKGVVIDEPVDPYIRMPFLMFICNILDTKKNPKRSSMFWKNRFSFEIVGNYVYKISQREFEKMAMGIALPAIAFYKFNHMRTENSFKGKVKYFFTTILSALGIIPYVRTITILFRELPDNDTKEALRKQGYYYYELPKNPYL